MFNVQNSWIQGRFWNSHHACYVKALCGDKPAFCIHICEDGSITGFDILDCVAVGALCGEPYGGCESPDVLIIVCP